MAENYAQSVSADTVEWVECVLEARTSSSIELEGGIKIYQDNMKTLDTTKKERKRKLKDKLAKLEDALDLEMRSRMFKTEPQIFFPIVTMKPHHID